MAFEFEDLDATTRRYMLDEMRRDIILDEFTLSRRLTEHGDDLFPDLLEEAINLHDEDWLAYQLEYNECIEAIEPRTVDGIVTMVKVPRNAAQLMAEAAFNAYYMRALCRRALDEGERYVEVYRAKPTATRRRRSALTEGARFLAEHLLTDLRQRGEVGALLGLGRSNSGLSVRRPHDTVRDTG